MIANRIWHYVFGQGIVGTPDNFGQLGDKPSHPELLDYLAQRMVKNGWSIKQLIRFVVTSDTWKCAAEASEEAIEKDPQNRYLSHANVRRLDAESIRDSLLAVSGQLEDQMFGPGFSANSDAKRRSVYITSRRNSLDEFLKTFDSPTPFATTGRRDITNVPSQSLTMLNDPFVLKLAEEWARSTEQLEPDARISTMFGTAFGRAAKNEELEVFRDYVAATNAEFSSQKKKRAKLEKQVAAATKAIESIVEPVRDRLKKATESDKKSNGNGVDPIAAWEFDDLKDSVGGHDIELRDGAKLDGGALVVGDGYAFTGRLNTDLEAKTLEAWVQLDTLDQGGGGVITVQSRNGVTFDSIVYAERRPQEWMAGSNGFVRTEDVHGPQEREAPRLACPCRDHLRQGRHDPLLPQRQTLRESDSKIRHRQLPRQELAGAVRFETRRSRKRRWRSKTARPYPCRSTLQSCSQRRRNGRFLQRRKLCQSGTDHGRAG